MGKYSKLIIEGLSRINEVIVWHGSTESFDKFDLDKVGSGDGKSLGGWGIYFSDSEEVSKRYYLGGGMLSRFRIPDGKYFDLDEGLDYGFAEDLVDRLIRVGVGEEEIEQFREDYIGYIEYGDVTNGGVYEWLSFVLGGDKEASLFLFKMGYIGNKFRDKWEREATNYVLFRDDIIDRLDYDE